MATSNTNGTPPARMFKHMLGTYHSLREGLAILGFAFPLVLAFGGMWVGVDLQNSMSAYYFADVVNKCGVFPMRVWFVGMLCAISAGLYAYKGFSKKENRLLNVAALFGLLVAVFPERLGDEQVTACGTLGSSILGPIQKAQQGQLPIHLVSAVAMFVCLAIVAWRYAPKSLRYLPQQHAHRRTFFERTYKVIAGAMFVSPLAAVAMAYLLSPDSRVFFVEAFAIWSFCSYWVLKSIEMRLSGAELKASHGEAPVELQDDWRNGTAALGSGDAEPAA